MGTGEMIFIFLAALIILGPKKLPEVGRMLAKGIAEFKRASAELKGSLEREMENLERDTKAAEATTTPVQTTYDPPTEPTEEPPKDPAETVEDHGYQDYTYSEHRD